MIPKKPLTERTIQSIKPTGQRFMVWDALVPGFGVRVTEQGFRSFCLVHRFPGSSNPTCRAIGAVGKVSLEWARQKAREWHQAIAEGNDPKQSKAETFKAIAEEYLAREGNKLKSIDQRKATLERLIYPALGHRPIAEIRRSDIHRLLDKVTDERGPETSHKVYGITKKIMDWHQARSDTFRSPIVRKRRACRSSCS